MQYRTDIDGLRAIAIIAVVAFHVGLPGWDGGFAGVDVFFAISGYLISSLLLRQFANTGTIDFLEFYASRARRLLPALTVVVTTTVLAAAVLLTPADQLTSTMQSAIASMLFSANFYFWRTTGGYFDDRSDSLPLLHMWSLGIEEQWYLIFPACLFVLLKVWGSTQPRHDSLTSSGRMLATVAVVCLASYLFCIVATT